MYKDCIIQGCIMKHVNSITCIILGGGRGTRLYPLVKERSKPAVPLGSQYRMIDIPVSNCINSGMRNIYVVTQFNSASLNNHVYNAYHFDPFSNGHISILAAEQTDANTDWYQGTADAVRKNISHFDSEHVEYVVILSGDQVYRMDYNLMFDYMVEKGADIVVSTVPVNKQDAAGFGIMRIDDDANIIEFHEKPKEEDVLNNLKLDDKQKAEFGLEPTTEKEYLGSMGIYIFKKEVLFDFLKDDGMVDFGQHIIPSAIKTHKVCGYVFNGFWEDVGTVKAYFETNLAFASKKPPFDFYDDEAPIYTNTRYLSASKISESNISETLIANGCYIGKSTIKQSVIGVRAVIGNNCTLDRAVMMGSDYYDSQDDIERNKKKGKPSLGIGDNCIMHNVIIDKNVRIGNNVIISNKEKLDDYDGGFYVIRDGIVIIPKNTVIPSETII